MASFDQRIDQLLSLLRMYSSEDVATALFVSDLWLPNVGGMLRHQLATAAYASLAPGEFAASRQIATYEELSSFLERLYTALPGFPSLEDYVPVPDWGEVRFHHGGTNYRIFYESEIEDVYDWLTLFRMLYGSLDAQYARQTGRSPARELRLCLELQDAVISSISIQPKGEELDALYPGHLEVPPEEFCDCASEVYRELRPETFASGEVLDRYSIRLGSVRRPSLEYSAFVEAFLADELLPCFFVVDGERYLPVGPRRWSCVLIGAWARMLDECAESIGGGTGRYSGHLTFQVAQYLGQRIRRGRLMPLVGAITGEGQPHAVVFAGGVLSEDKLVLIYVTKPATSGELLGAELSAVAPSLHEAAELMSASPLRLAMHSEKEVIEFRAREGRDPPRPLLLVVFPVASTEPVRVPIPESFPARVVPLDQFLGMVDEMSDPSDIASFLEYLKALEGQLISPVTSMLDLFASFKDTHGLLVGGAREPNGIVVDPHWGSHLRYKTLAQFWSIYPDVHFMGEPRSWEVERETPSRLRLIARGYVASAIHCEIGRTHVFMLAPFDAMSVEQVQLSDLLMQCLEDGMSAFAASLATHPFFASYEQARVNFYPDRLLAEDSEFSHLRHLEPSQEYWRSDTGFAGPAIPGIRLVFDEEAVAHALETADDRSFETALLLEVLTCMNSVVPSSHFSEIADAVSKRSTDPARFRLSRLEKEVSFPDFVPVYKPERFHYKRARKRLAQLAAELEIGPGCYEPEDAKENVNALRSQLVREIDTEVAQYEYEAAVPYLLERIDALSNEYEQRRRSVQYSLTHEVDYEREDTLADEHGEYIAAHRAFRYVIEKFVQLQPQGSVALDKEGFQSLVAVADVLQGLYMASDAIHYDIHAVGLEIDDDWLVQVEYEPELRAKEVRYGRQQAALDLGQTGHPDDRLDYVTPLDDYMRRVDGAFSSDMGFTLTNLLGMLRVLSEWAAFDSRVEESTWYSADAATIQEVCVQAVDDLQAEQVVALIEFLTLNPSDVIRIFGEDRACDDVPVWEHRKRPWRYNLRPLILIRERFFWGPHSARKTGIIWSNVPREGRLPAAMQAPSVLRVLVEEKRRVQNALTAKAAEIALRHADYAEQNVRLHRRDTSGQHPEELGDYDVLAFDPDANVVVIVECKDVSGAYCLKDARRLRERIFGRAAEYGGQVGRVERRHEYLSANLARVANVLGWPVDPGDPPRVVSVFVSRVSYWWTAFPPRPTGVMFSRLDMLDDVLAKLRGPSGGRAA